MVYDVAIRTEIMLVSYTQHSWEISVALQRKNLDRMLRIRVECSPPRICHISIESTWIHDHPLQFSRISQREPFRHFWYRTCCRACCFHWIYWSIKKRGFEWGRPLVCGAITVYLWEYWRDRNHVISRSICIVTAFKATKFQKISRQFSILSFHTFTFHISFIYILFSSKTKDKAHKKEHTYLVYCNLSAKRTTRRYFLCVRKSLSLWEWNVPF